VNTRYIKRGKARERSLGQVRIENKIKNARNTHQCGNSKVVDERNLTENRLVVQNRGDGDRSARQTQERECADIVFGVEQLSPHDAHDL
jgi:hypothetical protein